MKELLKKKTTKIGIAVIILAVAIGIISINARSVQRQREYDGHVEAAEKYLTELDYEQAIAEYTLALEIEPNNEEVLNALEQTYLAYAQSLADAGEYEKAVSVLEEGYAQTGRESLREKIEEVTELQVQKEEEARLLAEEEARREVIRQTVESEEFQDKLSKIPRRWIDEGLHLSDSQIAELSRPFLDILDEYRRYFPDDYNSDSSYRTWLQTLSYNCGEYELCKEVCGGSRRHPLGGDGYIEFDEYGRLYQTYSVLDDRKQEEKWEYGENGKEAKTTHTIDFYDGTTNVDYVMYEYDSEGRLIKLTYLDHDENSDGSWDDLETVSTYAYNEKGFTELDNIEWYKDGQLHTILGETMDFEVDEYGNYEQVGETYDNYFEKFY